MSWQHHFPFMLTNSFIALTCAVLLGLLLALLHVRGASRVVPWPLGVLHGLLGLSGLGLLIVALQGPPHGLEQGTGSFGSIGAVLVGAAALAGGAIFVRYRLAHRSVSALIGIHATLAIGGFVILAVYVFS